ncbi:RING-H2 finger protein ATL57-like [Andrographis paniculata]|uniref:RING-H2 finger protein ATL57-like n=1 Tax=Andrographis paniculata TaxID=175694 RepID=UPI0021E99BAD|nr:RING-H2 finger protein ATL57-like [Andrographis paniculata]
MMKPSILSSRRFLLQAAAAAQPPPGDPTSTFNPTTPFDSSMALTILVLLTALFFMGFFSVYIRRFTAAEEENSQSPPRRAAPPPQEKRGLDPCAVESLPVAAYGAATKHPMIDDCPICLGEFRDGDTVKAIPYCGHVFHPKCLDTWLWSHVTCPLCRSAQLFSEEVRLDVKPSRESAGSTAGDKDTCRAESSGGVRRVCSCAELANRTALQRTTSF